ncbi:hypothetical protein HY992_00180 [Candidatus Micrarchaeota archaeon]|nr:hypothetical protein [Candidatus Micrarchaeota archaeon]
MKATTVLCLFLAFSILSFADQVEEISVQIGTISQFVKVGTDLKFDAMLPGYSYKGTLNVSWAVSSDSLKGMEQDEAQLYFLLSSRNNESVVTFIKDGKKYESASGVLKCAVKNGECGQGSQLSEEIGVQIKVKEEGRSLVEVIVLNASSKPVAGGQEKIEASNSANVNTALGEIVETVQEYASEADTLNDSDTASKGELEPAAQGSVQGKQAEGEADSNAFANELALGDDKKNSASLLSESNAIWIALAAFLILAAGYTGFKIITRKKGFEQHE